MIQFLIMTIRNLLSKSLGSLKHFSQTAELDSEVLLAHVLGKNRVFIVANYDQEISKNKCSIFFDLVKRRKKGEPIAYIVGYKEFYGLEFKVNKNVLIPRPETEELVKMIIKRIKTDERIKQIRIIDVGTGSGNVGISLINRIVVRNLNKKIKFCIVLSDISLKALEVAKKNYKALIKNTNNVDVKFVKSGLLKEVAGKFDIIVSNLPYIPTEEIHLLDKSVKGFEPRKALDGGEGGMDLIRDLINQIHTGSRLKRGGEIFLEIYEEHPLELKMFIEENYPDYKVSFMRDTFGEWRFCMIE